MCGRQAGIIHIRTRTMRALLLPAALTASSYRMRVTPVDETPVSGS